MWLLLLGLYSMWMLWKYSVFRNGLPQLDMIYVQLLVHSVGDLLLCNETGLAIHTVNTPASCRFGLQTLLQVLRHHTVECHCFVILLLVLLLFLSWKVEVHPDLGESLQVEQFPWTNAVSLAMVTAAWQHSETNHWMTLFSLLCSFSFSSLPVTTLAASQEHVTRVLL